MRALIKETMIIQLVNTEADQTPIPDSISWVAVASDTTLKDTYVDGAVVKFSMSKAESLATIRQQRDVLLSETDWMANSDVTMSDAWKAYRKALRDVPAQADMDNITWPTKP